MNKFKTIKIASILGVIGNFLLFIIKAVIGFFSHSQAIIADSFNSLGDIFSSIMTFVGNKIASKPVDEDHNLGHGKAEYIYALLISIAMFIMAYTSFKDSIFSLIHKEKLIFSKWLVIGCLVTIITKIFLWLFTKHAYNKYPSLLLKASYKDHRNDAFITTSNLIAILLSSRFFYLDGIMGILIASWIFISALEIFKNSYDILMDKSIDEETKQKVLDIIKTHPEVKKIQHFNSTPIGYQYQISFTIFVDGNLSTFESHDIADSLEDEIGELVPEVYLTVIHVNPLKIKKN